MGISADQEVVGTGGILVKFVGISVTKSLRRWSFLLPDNDFCTLAGVFFI